MNGGLKISYPTNSYITITVEMIWSNFLSLFSGFFTIFANLTKPPMLPTQWVLFEKNSAKTTKNISTV